MNKRKRGNEKEGNNRSGNERKRDENAKKIQGRQKRGDRGQSQGMGLREKEAKVGIWWLTEK